MNRKKVLALLAVTVTFSTVMTACGFGGGDDDQMVVETTPVPEPTKAPKATPTPVPADAQSNTYRSADKSVAITLPDATWANKADESDMLSFESPEQGKLLILHGKGDEDMSVAVPPRTPDVAVSLERASDLEQGTDFVIHDFTSSETNGINVYSYTTEYLTDKSGYAYVVNKYFENEDEFYSITGSVKKKDEKLLKKVKKSVNSFTIKGDSSLKSAAPGKSDKKKEETPAADNAGADNSGEQTQGEESTGSVSTEEYGGDAVSDTNQTRTIYRNSDGSALVIYNDGNGNWSDEDGNTYNFINDEDVYDQNDEDYYYHGEAADVYYMPYE